MLNDLRTFSARYDMIAPGDEVVCAVSGGADSMALLWGLYLLREQMGFSLSAAHFNHGLRGAESDRDEAFVREFCTRYEIPLTVGAAPVKSGEKGLEAAARDARYAFLESLPGKIATAHTADDNAETVLMRLIRGTGLRGLGGIAPVRGRIIRPMLTITRQQVENFLGEYHIPWIQDSSNDTDQFLRNRIRHNVMPLLKEENPKLAENLSTMALSLRLDDQALMDLAQKSDICSVDALRQMPPGIRSRALTRFLENSGVREPEMEHIALAESLAFSDNPSARGNFPGGVVIRRSYDTLTAGADNSPLNPVALNCPGVTRIPELGLTVGCRPAQKISRGADAFTVHIQGQLILRGREPGDAIRLPGGTKSLKKLFIDRKIPAHERLRIPILVDERGVVGVYGIGVDQNHAAMDLPAVEIQFITETSADS